MLLARLKNMQEPETWRNLLKMIISDPHEKQRIAEELAIRPITLDRWIIKATDPRPQNLRHLLNTLPQYREQLLNLIRQEPGFEEFSNAGLDDSSTAIPSSFYTRVFSSLTSTIDNLRFWSICNLILQQALGQLDPDRLGLSMVVGQCMIPPPGDTKVRSLRESVGLGTPPWATNLEHKGLFLGAESLAGYAVTSCHYLALQNVEESHSLIPVSHVEHEKSAAIYPILYTGRVAGCLTVSSTQYNYFLSQSRLSLIQHYANLIAIAFDPKDFYDPQDIELRIMPAHQIQKKSFSNFRQLVANTMIEGSRNGQPVNSIQAEQTVWQQLEAELIAVHAGR